MSAETVSDGAGNRVFSDAEAASLAGDVPVVDYVAQIERLQAEDKAQARAAALLKGRLRRTAHALIEVIGAARPEDADETAIRAAKEIERLRAAVSAAVAFVDNVSFTPSDKDHLAAKTRVFLLAALEDTPAPVTGQHGPSAAMLLEYGSGGGVSAGDVRGGTSPEGPAAIPVAEAERDLSAAICQRDDAQAACREWRAKFEAAERARMDDVAIVDAEVEQLRAKLTIAVAERDAAVQDSNNEAMRAVQLAAERDELQQKLEAAEAGKAEWRRHLQAAPSYDMMREAAAEAHKRGVAEGSAELHTTQEQRDIAYAQRDDWRRRCMDAIEQCEAAEKKAAHWAEQHDIEVAANERVDAKAHKRGVAEGHDRLRQVIGDVARGWLAGAAPQPESYPVGLIEAADYVCSALDIARSCGTDEGRAAERADVVVYGRTEGAPGGRDAEPMYDRGYTDACGWLALGIERGDHIPAAADDGESKPGGHCTACDKPAVDCERVHGSHHHDNDLWVASPA